MGRSVVLAGAARCPRCSLPPRWCTCDMLPPVESQLAVHVLIHRGEQRKPSSTGTLVARAVTGAERHLFQRETRFFTATGFPADAIEPGRDLWILHPGGNPLPTPSAATDGARGSRQPVLLLDGTWRQAGEMLRAVERLGRCIRLPDAGHEPSRYWLRDQPTPTQLSTAEALMGVFRSVGEHEAERRLRLHFELHVYATLLARGKREMAERYLGHSPLLTDATEVLDRLLARRAAR
ncbi:MAG: tRNA-uridine aminocarboxypropyltransferase [Planctomycetaceae bacterium]